MDSVTTSLLCVMYSTISLSPALFTSLYLRSLRGSLTKSKRTQHWRSFWTNSSSRSIRGESAEVRGQRAYCRPAFNNTQQEVCKERYKVQFVKYIQSDPSTQTNKWKISDKDNKQHVWRCQSFLWQQSADRLHHTGEEHGRDAVC